MPERCAIRPEADYPYKDISEQDLPTACVECIQRALEEGRADRKTIDSNPDAMNELQEYYGDHSDTSAAARWVLDSATVPDDTSRREASIQLKFNVKTRSYQEGNTFQTQLVTFDCPNDQL